MDDIDVKQQIRNLFYHHVHIEHNGANEPRWRGIHVIKFPTDLMLYAEQIWNNKPDCIIETGTKFGGSALFFADILSLFCNNSKVITVDIKDMVAERDLRIEYLIGSSADRKIFEYIKNRVIGKKVMVILDSDHRYNHVRRELRLYGRLVTPGQFLVVEDSYMRNEVMKSPGHAIKWYLDRTKKYVMESPEEKYFVALTRGGWLRRLY